jgi:hypothetical protein
VGFIQKPREKYVLFALAGDHELVAHIV